MFSSHSPIFLGILHFAGKIKMGYFFFPSIIYVTWCYLYNKKVGYCFRQSASNLFLIRELCARPSCFFFVLTLVFLTRNLLPLGLYLFFFLFEVFLSTTFVQPKSVIINMSTSNVSNGSKKFRKSRFEK